MKTTKTHTEKDIERIEKVLIREEKRERQREMRLDEKGSRERENDRENNEKVSFSIWRREREQEECTKRQERDDIRKIQGKKELRMKKT